jgi:ribosome maturation factor RimP
MAGNIIDQIDDLVVPVLAGQGFELVLAEYVSGQRLLRLFVDKEGGVTLDDCAQVSRLVGDLMDAEGLSDAIEGRYRLEVSSPGLDRPLVKPEHFQRFIGSKAKLTTKVPQYGRRRFEGEILEADAMSIRFRIEGEDSDCSFAYDMIERARLIPEF